MRQQCALDDVRLYVTGLALALICFVVTQEVLGKNRGSTPMSLPQPIDPQQVQDQDDMTCDDYRLSIDVAGRGGSAQLLNELAAVRFGASQTIPVFVQRASGSADIATVTLTAISESDPAQKATVTLTVKG